MRDLITKITKQYNLFKIPNAIGDVIEHNGMKYLIITIQRFHYDSLSKALNVSYIVQRINQPYSINKATVKTPNTYAAYFHYPLKMLETYDFKREVKPIQHNDIAYFERINATARVIEITKLSFNGTDLVVNVIVQPVYPVPREQLLRIRKQESGFKLVEID